MELRHTCSNVAEVATATRRMRSISVPEGDLCGSWLGALGFAVLIMVGVCLSPGVARAQVDCSATGTTGVPQIECEALMALYFSTDGTNWTDNSNWDTASAVSTWFGVAASGGQVTGLSLGTNQLTGTIPSEIGNLSDLATLYLSNDQLTGPIPPGLATCPTPTFKVVDAAAGYFTPGTSLAVPVPAGATAGDVLIAQIGYNAAGTITPPAGWNLIDVTTNPSKPIMQGLYWRAASASEPTHYDFGLSSDKDDTAVGAIAAYRGIDLTNPIDAVGAQTDSGSTNIVAPSIGTSTVNTTLISFFSVRDDGAVTSPAGTTEQWDVNSAAGVGAIGETLLAAADEIFTIVGDTGVRVASAQNSDGSVAHLVALRPTPGADPIANQLSGSIPPELGNLSNLTTLYLSGNQLTGPIPSELGDLSNLTTACLHSNQLAGPMPPELGNLSSLDTLYLYGNQLTGPIPPELGDLSNLTSLQLSSNQLSGDIPDLTSLPLSSLRFESNAFVFADFEPEFVAYNDGAPASFRYSPQAMVDTARTVSFPSGAPAVLPFAVVVNPSGNDQYQWYKDGAPIAGPYGISRDLDVTLGGGSVVPADAGNYEYTISNAVVIGLTLTSRVITLAVSATCGSGSVDDPTELCEDGNPCASDGDCLSGVCDTNEAPPICEPAGSCGNGVLDEDEVCDDGDLERGDGCSQSCTLENVWRGGGGCAVNRDSGSGEPGWLLSLLLLPLIRRRK